MRPGFFSALKPEHKEAIGLLQVGTFLEYFDLMLYVHMAFLLNEVFFPKTDPQTTALITAFAFCSTYILRPIGGLFFGYIGDYIGRKMTVIISSMMMGVSCMVMASLPTYAQIGITAAWGVTFCRVLQGLACQGEIIGAEVYLIEVTKPPLRYPVVAFCSFFASLGGMLALGLTVLLFFFQIDWRLAFWIGAGISSVGFVARTRLRETPEFIKMKQHRQDIKESEKNESKQKPIPHKDKINKLTMLAYFIISCGYPACFFLAYLHFGTVLKNSYGYTSEQLIHHNFLLSIGQCLSFLFYAGLSYFVNPLKILNYRLLVFFPIIALYPFWLSLIETPNELLIFQLFIISFGIMDIPAAGIMMNHFPVLKRITSTSLIYAFSRMLIYILTSFGVIQLSESFSNWGIWFMMMILCFGFAWSIHYFKQIEGMPNRSWIAVLHGLQQRLTLKKI